MAERKMLTIKDYAELKNISYEAVRKQVVRYKLELDGHIFTEGKRQYLDEVAIEFLDNKRASNPIIVMEEDKMAMMEQLKEENEKMQKQLIANQQEMIALQQKLMVSIEDNHSKQLLIEQNERKIQEYDRVNEAWKQANMDKMSAEYENSKLKEEKEAVEQNFRTLEQVAKEREVVYQTEIDKFNQMTPREFKKYKKQLKKNERKEVM